MKSYRWDLGIKPCLAPLGGQHLENILQTNPDDAKS